MHKIKVQFGDRDPGTVEIEVEPSFTAIAERLETVPSQLRISTHKNSVLIVRAPWNDHYILITHADFKLVL